MSARLRPTDAEVAAFLARLAATAVGPGMQTELQRIVQTLGRRLEWHEWREVLALKRRLEPGDSPT